jgi:anti-anti-sigma regulatory factor
MDSTGLKQLVRATRSASAEQPRVVLVMGKRPIDRAFAVSGVERAFETTADSHHPRPPRP